MSNLIHPIASAREPSQNNAEMMSVEQRLGFNAEGAQGDPYLDAIYASLKGGWQDSPNIGAAELIQRVARFVAADGTSPYQNMRTHVAVLSQIMQKMKSEGEQGSELYKALDQSIGYSIISNGFLDSFIGNMMQRPEEPDGW